MKHAIKIIVLMMVTIIAQISIHSMGQRPSALGKRTQPDISDVERQEAEKRRAILAGAAQGRIGQSMQRAEESELASLAGLPNELKMKIALEIVSSGETLKQGLQRLLNLARVNKELFALLQGQLFINQIKQQIKQNNQQEELNNLLINYSKVGDVYAVDFLLKIGADVNAQDYQFDASIIHAVKNGHRAVVDLLIAKGANSNFMDSEGLTPLMLAVRDDNREMVKLLIEKVDINFDTSTEWDTALVLAAGEDKPEMVTLLLVAGANINDTDNEGMTPLMHAAQNGKKNTVLILLTARPDINATDGDGKTALDFARESNQPEIVELIETAQSILNRTQQ